MTRTLRASARFYPNMDSALTGVVRIYGDPLPSAMEEHDVVVIFRGPQSANDAETPDASGSRAELKLIPSIPDYSTPFLGICLGAQLLAKSLGARADAHPEGWIEAGYYQLRLTLAGQPYLEGPIIFYQWHREGFEVQSGASLLAESEIFANQAFKYGFHPEVRNPPFRNGPAIA